MTDKTGIRSMGFLIELLLKRKSILPLLIDIFKLFLRGKTQLSLRTGRQAQGKLLLCLETSRKETATA